MKSNIVIKMGQLASTFSIVAFDPVTKDLGVTVQSRYFSVGSVVPWAEAGVGAIATQSFVNVSYGPRGLQLLKEGLNVDEVIGRLTRDDEGKDFRQLGIVDSKGNASAFTGSRCLEWAGSKVGKNYAAQGNILAGEDVVNGMVEKFESTQGELADKLVSALEGGQESGGDARGKQSAALLVVRKNVGRAGYGDRYIDLRVEDHPDPIVELKRLLVMHRVYRLIDDGEEKMATGDAEAGLSMIREAVSLGPTIDDAHIDLGIICLKLGKKDEALKAFKESLKLNPRMKNLIKQLPGAGLMEPSPEVFKELGIT
nr:DUF1028 domain-containing protein [Candidatus Njordarchaeum guaymaensis]